MTVVASNFQRQVNDLYETPAWCTEALLRHVDVAGQFVWEPAAGNHAISDVLEAHGARVRSSDVAVYDRPHMVADFLNKPLLLVGCQAIITNPPYGRGNRDAVTFAERALRTCRHTVALLLTAKFDAGKTRRHLFADNPRFSMKITLLDRPVWFPDGPYATGTEDFAWYVWDEGPNEFPRIVYEGRR